MDSARRLTRNKSLDNYANAYLQAWPRTAYRQLDDYAPRAYKCAHGWTSMPQHFLRVRAHDQRRHRSRYLVTRARSGPSFLGAGTARPCAWTFHRSEAPPY